MYRMAPIKRPQLNMARNYLASRKLTPDDGFEIRDICMLYRVKGRYIAKELPGIGKECKWLDRKTDEDMGPYYER